MTQAHSPMRSVGVLGGMGPEATILLMQRVLAAVTPRDDADHLPLIVHQNPQVPSRIAALIDGTGPSPAPALQAMARDLAAAGATALAMPCNTAHAYRREVMSATDLPFLDMVAASAMAVAGQRVGMLASPAVRMARVFDADFASTAAQPVWAIDDAPLLAQIRAVKAGAGGADIAADLAREADALLAQGADVLLVACSELSLAVPHLPPDLPVKDSLDCLVHDIVRHARPA